VVALMIERIEVVGLDSFLTAYGQKYPAAVRAGTSEGVKRYTDNLAADVRAHTPVKSGRARAAVYDRMRGELTSVVGYDKKEAWWVVVLAFGSRPHPIFARGLKGSADSRRLGAYLRRHGRQMSAAGIASTSFTYLGANATQFTGAKNARALYFGGRFASWVRHPGVKGRHTLTSRLKATSQQATEFTRAAIQVQIEKAGH